MSAPEPGAAAPGRAAHGPEYVRADIHDGLLSAILKNADEDLNGFDGTREQEAEHYVRWLEAERERLVALADEAREPQPAPGTAWTDSLPGGHINEPLTVREPQPAPELALGPCPFDGHDGEHLRLNTHGHWLCAITLTDMLVAADVITDEPLTVRPSGDVKHADLFARAALAENQIDAQERVIADYREEVTRLMAERDRLREQAGEAGYDAALVSLAALRSGITGLIRELDESAAATRPSRKSDIEFETAIALRRLLEES